MRVSLKSNEDDQGEESTVQFGECLCKKVWKRMAVEKNWCSIQYARIKECR